MKFSKNRLLPRTPSIRFLLISLSTFVLFGWPAGATQVTLGQLNHESAIISGGAGKTSRGGKTAAAGRTPAALSLDMCMQDDANGNQLQWSSQTGFYRFIPCGGGPTISGQGRLKTVSTIQMVTDFKTDRRVSATYLTNQLTGRAAIYVLLSPGIWQTFTINDTRSHGHCGCFS